MASQHSPAPPRRREDHANDALISWLLAGDPAIAWQTHRDLLAAPPPVWQPLRERTLTEGWGARLLTLQAPDGGWGGGVYSPKWTSATYTMLTLCDLGVPAGGPATERGARHVLAGLFGEHAGPAFQTRLAACDRCIVGMALRIACTFVGDDPRIEPLVMNLLAEQMPDGGWNCRRHRRPQPSHSSFHTTLNVLEGIRAYLESGATAHRQELVQAEEGALELLLLHRLYRSDKTGAVIREEWTHPVYPYRWHYDILRALAYCARADAPRDGRFADAVGLLEQRRQADGRWLRGKAYSGRVFFTMEPAGASRWNTLRALRVLHWWQGE
jgi:hypothetical protein